MPDERVSDEFIAAVLREGSFYGPLIKGMALELRERRQSEYVIVTVQDGQS